MPQPSAIQPYEAEFTWHSTIEIPIRRTAGSRGVIAAFPSTDARVLGPVDHSVEQSLQPNDQQVFPPWMRGHCGGSHRQSPLKCDEEAGEGRYARLRDPHSGRLIGRLTEFNLSNVTLYGLEILLIRFTLTRTSVSICATTREISNGWATT